MEKEKLINKVLSYATSMHLPEHETPHYFYNQKAFNNHIKELFGNEAFQVSKFLWKEGYLHLNVYGYVGLSDRGYTLLHDGKETPKRQKKNKPSLEQILDYFFEHNRERFEKWLETKNFKLSHDVNLNG